MTVQSLSSVPKFSLCNQQNLSKDLLTGTLKKDFQQGLMAQLVGFLGFFFTTGT